MDLSCVVLIGIWLWILWDAQNCIRIGNHKRRQEQRKLMLCRRMKGHIRGTTASNSK